MNSPLPPMVQMLATSVIRIALASAGGALVTAGTIDAGTADALQQQGGGVLLILITAAWSWYSKRRTKAVVSDALNKVASNRAGDPL